MTSPPKKRDPVLHNQLNSARNKHDILKDINESAATLDLAPLDSSLVFCRSKVEEQVEVTKKALAYVEIIVTSTCVHLLKGHASAGNPVSLPAAQINVLPRDVVVTVYSTAGSATMTTTVKLWGYTIASGVWVPLGTGADATKGTINAGAAIGETAGIADVIRHSEIVSGLFNFDRVYAELTAIGGTATAITVDVLIVRPDR